MSTPTTPQPLQQPQADDTRSPLKDLLAKPLLIEEENAEALMLADAAEQAEAVSLAISRRIFERLDEKVKGGARGGKLVVFQTWHSCWMTAYVVERRGRGLLVRADGVEAWLPAEKVYVRNEVTIEVPEWLLRRRGDEFCVLDCREGRRPRLSWNSDSGGNYVGGD